MNGPFINWAIYHFYSSTVVWLGFTIILFNCSQKTYYIIVQLKIPKLWSVTLACPRWRTLVQWQLHVVLLVMSVSVASSDSSRVSDGVFDMWGNSTPHYIFEQWNVSSIIILKFSYMANLTICASLYMMILCYILFLKTIAAFWVINPFNVGFPPVKIVVMVT